MFGKLKKKWGVNNLQLFLIICTFALGGSTCGFLGKRILAEFFVEKGLMYYIIYILLVTILWPLCVYVISIPLGQSKFFGNYIRKILKRFKIKQ